MILLFLLQLPNHNDLFLEPLKCNSPPPYLNVDTYTTYKAQNDLMYPINVGRNIARLMAQTHYVFSSDIELYPSPNVIPTFLEMIARNDGPLLSPNPKVFPLSIYEIAFDQKLPVTKKHLQFMLINGTAIPFHKEICPSCHKIPKGIEWETAPEMQGLHIFHVAKRKEIFTSWEPIHIGTHADPLFDERFTWEGKLDKMAQVCSYL